MKLARYFWGTATAVLLLFVTGTLCSATTRRVGQPKFSEGIFEAYGAGTAGGVEGYNEICDNTVNDAYSGVVFVATSHVKGGGYFNVLYPKLLSNGNPGPPPTEPPLP